MVTAADRKLREERVKLLASAVSNVGTAFVIYGLVSPLVTGHPNALAIVLSFAAAAAFHLSAQFILRYIAD